MKSTDDHSIFTTLIGSSASSKDIATIPETQATAGDGTASLALAFPPETFIALAAGGKPPRGADMNGFLRLLSHAVQALQAGYVGQYNATLAQSIGGYPSGAIVSGSSIGTFWVSTADNNVTTPGASGAAWQSLFAGYITQAQSDARYLMLSSTALQTVSGPVTFGGTTLVPAVADWTKRQAVGAADADARYVKNAKGNSGGIVSATMDSSGVPSFQSGEGNWYPVQLRGDYATNTDLNSEAQRASTIESNLQSSKANLSGGNQFSGDQTVNGNVIVGMGMGWAGGTSSGQVRWTNGHLAFGAPYNSLNSFTGYFQITDTLGNPSGDYSGIDMFGFDFSGARYEWHFPWNGNIITPKGYVAFQSDLNNYVSNAQYSSDFSTSDSRVINLPYNHKTQKFTFQGTPNAGQLWVPFPEAFSDIPVVLVSINNETIGQFSQRYVCIRNNTDGTNSPNITSTGFLSYSAWGNSSGTYASSAPLTLQVVAFGAK